MGASGTVEAHFETSTEFFQLFCRLLNSANATRCSLPLAQDLLAHEVDLIRNVRVSLRSLCFLSSLHSIEILCSTNDIVRMMGCKITYVVVLLM